MKDLIFTAYFCMLFISHSASCRNIVLPQVEPIRESKELNKKLDTEMSIELVDRVEHSDQLIVEREPIIMPLLALCGNDITENPYEACDDGNRLNGDGCSSICQVEICGNAVLDYGEECDDGNINSDDSCSDSCLLENCGDGIINGDEECDDDNITDGDGCSKYCLIEICGNGILDPDEECDDGNILGDDDCSSTCEYEFCGDGIIQTGEDCEPPSVGTCNLFCKTIACGDGFFNPVAGVEECEDGNAIAGDGCFNCLLESCGNAEVDLHEVCDDGNNISGDGCSSICQDEVCGNGILDPDEECDDSNVASNDACSSSCLIESCGDGVTQTGESCDDGNANNGDSCDNFCRIPVCGDGIIQGNEECDDGNVITGDGCNSNCTVITIAENCIDGIDNDLDGSSDLHDSDCKAVFVTSNAYSGNLLLEVTANPGTYASCGAVLTGLAAADCICNTLAANSSVAFINDSERNKSYVAFLSDTLTTVNAIDRLDHNGQYLNAAGLLLADSISDLVDADSLLNPINRNQNNQVIASGNVWTGSNSAGQANLLENCTKWIVGTILTNGGIGNLATTSTSWVDAGSPINCANTARLYCFEL